MATRNNNESSSEERETSNIVSPHAELRALPPRDQLVVSLRGVDQTQTNGRIVSKILARSKITEEQWRIFEEKAAVMAINDYFNGDISEYNIKKAIVEFVEEKGNLHFKARDLLEKIPEYMWNS